MQPDAGCTHRPEPIDALVSDCPAAGNDAPLAFTENLDRIELNLLAIVQPFHCQSTVEGHRAIEIHFENPMMRADGRGPEGVGIAVQCEFLFQPGLCVLPRKVVSVAGADGISEFFQPPNVGFRDQSALIRSDAEYK